MCLLPLLPLAVRIHHPATQDTSLFLIHKYFLATSRIFHMTNLPATTAMHHQFPMYFCILYNQRDATYISSSSIGTTAHCGLWPVEQYYPSIFPYLSPTLSIFSLPALEDLFLLPLSIFSWVFPFVSSPSSWMKIFLGILSSSIPSS